MGDASLAAESCRADDVVVEAAEADAVVAAGEINEGGGKGGGGGELGDGGESNSGEDHDKVKSEEGDRNYAGNRWPRQETLALLKIRSDMDATFRDSTLKGPLWEDVSRKMAALGYNRSAKKCKEKFENVYKYHKRTKDGRATKSEGKTYRFFDQLEAFGSHHHSNPPLSKPLPPPPPPQVISTATTPWTTNPSAPTISHIFAPISQPPNITNPTTNIPPLPPTPTNPTNSLPLHTKSSNPSLISTIPHASSNFQTISANLFSSSTSSSTASDEEFQRRHKRKRKWKDFFRRLTKEVLHKQEELQKKFLETVEKCEHDRMVREEAWRLQEMSRINKEHEILVQERSTAAAKDAAVIAFLQKVSGGGGGGGHVGGGQQNTNGEVRVNIMSLPPPPPPPPPQLPQPQQVCNLEISKLDYNQNNNVAAAAAAAVAAITTSCSSRWPKTEVQALIQMRTNLDLKYQDNGPKGPLWEEISAGMRRIGYNRSAKRCKEKWENINKYFKKVKDNNKKRSEDSKTCPYFHQLDALYRERNKMDSNNNIIISCNNNNDDNNNNVVVADHHQNGKAEKPVVNMGMEPLMVQPERQWPLQEDQNQLDSVMEDVETGNAADPNHDEEEDDDDDDDDGDDDDGDSTEDDEERGGYEIVTNKQSSMDMVE